MTPIDKMAFSSEPTARADDVAAYVREWYEANRESWIARHMPDWEGRGGVADNFVLGLVAAVGRIVDASKRGDAP